MSDLEIVGEVKFIRSEHFKAWEYKRVSPVHGVVYVTELVYDRVGAKITENGPFIKITMEHVTKDTVRDTTEIEYHTSKFDILKVGDKDDSQ